MVVGVHSDMIIARESVHEAEELVTNSGIHYKVDTGEGKAIFRASPINIGRINAESSFAIRFLDENHISQPIGINYFSNSSGWRSLPTSSLIAFYLSGVKLLLFCLMGLKEGVAFNLWVIAAR